MNVNIPVIKSSMPPYEEYIEEIKDLWDTRWLTNHGQKAAKLEAETAKLLGSEYAGTCVNGHQAIELILRAYGFAEGSEVITSPFTFVSTTAAIVRCGLKPVFCDIREEDYTLDPNCLEALITDKTCAIMPIHVYGNICDDDSIREIADRHDLKVIYDAAHAFGVEKNGKKAGSFGDAAVFSLHATKAFHSIEGGLIAYHEQDLGMKLWEQQNFGISSPDTVSCVAPNAKMNEFQAAMGLCNLRHFHEYVQSRKQCYEAYRAGLKDVPGIYVNEIPQDTVSNYAYLPIRVVEEEAGFNRNDLFDFLAEQQVGSRKYFWPLTSSFPCYNSYKTTETPIADRVSEQILVLPMYSDLTIDQVEYICNVIQKRRAV